MFIICVLGVCLMIVDIQGRGISGSVFRRVNFSGVPAKLLAKAISSLQTVNLWTVTYAKQLTPNQCAKVLEAILTSQTLINVEMDCNYLREVNADLLARAISRLETVNLECTSLTTDQCVKVMEACISSTTLVNVSLSFVNLTELWQLSIVLKC